MDKLHTNRACVSLIVAICVVSAFFFSCAYTTGIPQDHLENAPDTEENLIESVEPFSQSEEIAEQVAENDKAESSLTSSPQPKGLEPEKKSPPLNPETVSEYISFNSDPPLNSDPPRTEIRYEPKRNSKVERYIKKFSGKGRKNFAEVLKRSELFIPEIKETLRSEGLPSELAYLPIIESGFKTTAVSRKKAVGLWQFIKPTGIRYGLRINHWVDERMDAEKATLAAAKYLKDMHDKFGSWELALAAYNCGEKRVSRAIARTGSTDFWVISRKLPRETRNYVPKFNAALIMAKNPKQYGFSVPKSEKDYEIVTVPPRKDLTEIASLLGIGYKKIYKHNPSLIGLATPPGESYKLRIPKGYGEKLTSAKAKLDALPISQFPFRTRPADYTVRPNDNLWNIARRFETSVEKLKLANHLSGSTIRPGQKLKIPVAGNTIYVKHTILPGENIYTLAKKYGSSVEEIKKANKLKSSLIIAGKTLSIPQKYPLVHVPRNNPRKMNHKIIPGDTLSEIALRYRVSVSQIKRWNNLSSTTLIAGRNLLIYK